MKTKHMQGLCTAFSFLVMMQTRLVYAAAPQELFELFITITGGLIVVVGAILGIIGLISYALAMSDGDGPAKKKAAMEIASGVALLVLSTTLIASKSSIATLIVT